MKKKGKTLTLQFVPFDEIANIGTADRIKKILKLVLEKKIVVLQGKLKPEEETRLIEDTMALVGTVKNFHGVELAVFSPKESTSIFGKLKRNIVKLLVGNVNAVTIIGPAAIVKEVKKDPSKIQFFLK